MSSLTIKKTLRTKKYSVPVIVKKNSQTPLKFPKVYFSLLQLNTLPFFLPSRTFSLPNISYNVLSKLLDGCWWRRNVHLKYDGILAIFMPHFLLIFSSSFNVAYKKNYFLHPSLFHFSCNWKRLGKIHTDFSPFQHFYDSFVNDIWVIAGMSKNHNSLISMWFFVYYLLWMWWGG